jgi:hypothetical protein
MDFEQWFIKIYGKNNPAIAPCRNVMRKAWLACRKQVLIILKGDSRDFERRVRQL